MNLIGFTAVFIFTVYLTLDICKSADNPCPEYCESCTGNARNLVCYCKSGEFYFYDACHPCNTIGVNCTSCSNASQCKECDIGKWSSRCFQDCAVGNKKCKDQMCSQENGHSTNGCMPNYYGSTCESVCSENCVGSTTKSKCDSIGKCISGCIDGFIGDTCTTEGRNQQNEETISGSVSGGEVGGVLGVCAVVALVVVVLVLKKKGIIWKESKKTYEDISPRRTQDKPYSALAVSSTTGNEIPESEPRSGLTIEGEDNRVYYNDERAYYKTIGGNVHKT